MSLSKEVSLNPLVFDVIFGLPRVVLERTRVYEAGDRDLEIDLELSPLTPSDTRSFRFLIFGPLDLVVLSVLTSSAV